MRLLLLLVVLLHCAVTNGAEELPLPFDPPAGGTMFEWQHTRGDRSQTSQLLSSDDFYTRELRDGRVEVSVAIFGRWPETITSDSLSSLHQFWPIHAGLSVKYTRSINGRRWRDSIRVGKKTFIDVPAGGFDVYPVKWKSDAVTHRWSGSCKFWYAPTLRWYVKYKCSDSGDSLDNIDWELASIYGPDELQGQSPMTRLAGRGERLPLLPAKLARIQSLEVETAARLSLEGQLFVDVDNSGRNGYEYCSISRALSEQGEFRAAIRAASISLFMGESGKDQYLTALAKRDLAVAYSFAGRLDLAEVLAGEAIEAADAESSKAKRDRVYRDAYKVLGDIALRRNRFDEAVDYYRLAIESAESQLTRLALANAYIGAGESDRASRLIEEVSQSEDRLLSPLLQRARGDLEVARGNYQQAVKYYGAAVDQSDRSDETYQQFVALAGMARAHTAAGNEDAALSAYREAVDKADLIRARFRSEEFKTGFFARIQDVFDEAIALLMSNGKGQEAFELSERSRSRALRDMVRNRVLLSEAATAFSKAQSEHVSLEKVQKSLPSGSTLLMYHVTESKTFAWRVRSDEFESSILDIGRMELSQMITEYRGKLQQREAVDKESQELYALLIDVLQLSRDETLIVVPHSSLHYLPFQSLSDGRGFVAQAHDVVYTPSAGVLVDLLQRQDKERDDLLALGNPDLGDPQLDLPGAQREVEEIGNLVADAAVFTRSEATKVRLKELAPSFSVLHVAAHAEVDEIDPLYSFIRLAPTREVSGDLEAHEIYRVKLSDTKLVTLSACDTGLGKIARGDEIWGFYRTFFSAGASALLVSLWPIDDAATARFMVAFYDALRTQSPSTAIRHAQNALLESPDYAHPFYWAAFNFIGAPR